MAARNDLRRQASDENCTLEESARLHEDITRQLAGFIERHSDAEAALTAKMLCPIFLQWSCRNPANRKQRETVYYNAMRLLAETEEQHPGKWQGALAVMFRATLERDECQFGRKSRRESVKACLATLKGLCARELPGVPVAAHGFLEHLGYSRQYLSCPLKGYALLLYAVESTNAALPEEGRAQYDTSLLEAARESHDRLLAEYPDSALARAASVGLRAVSEHLRAAR